MNLLNNSIISKTILTALVIGLTFTSMSCKDAKKENKTTEKTSVEKKGKEHTSAYVCPMHCENSGSDKEGKCPTCGMTYIDNKIHSANGHKH